MEYAPDLLVPVDAVTSPGTLPGRRLHHRQRMSTLAYVNLDQSNGGIVRDLSEAGLAIQTVTPLRINQQVQLRFDLLRPRMHLETLGRVAWADSRGQAGVQFQNMNDRSRRSIKQWIFTQLLARAHQVAEAGFVFSPSDGAGAADHLLFSAAPRSAIQLVAASNRESTSPPSPIDTHQETSAETLYFAWLPLSISRRLLAYIADGLILCSALLLFFLVAKAIMQIFPASQIAGALLIAAAGLFAALYWFLFVNWMGITPGERLAQSISGETLSNEEEDRPRFR